MGAAAIDGELARYIKEAAEGAQRNRTFATGSRSWRRH